MKKDWRFKRGGLYYANLDPIIGSEQGGTRPVLVIQNNTGNHFSPTVIIAPLTSRIKEKHTLPTHYPVPPICSLTQPSIILLEQLKTIDKCRIYSYIGQLNRLQMQDVDLKILFSLGISYSLVQRTSGNSNEL